VKLSKDALFTQASKLWHEYGTAVTEDGKVRLLKLILNSSPSRMLSDQKNASTADIDPSQEEIDFGIGEPTRPLHQKKRTGKSRTAMTAEEIAEFRLTLAASHLQRRNASAASRSLDAQPSVELNDANKAKLESLYPRPTQVLDQEASRTCPSSLRTQSCDT
jgi:hypothetical protein